MEIKAILEKIIDANDYVVDSRKVVPGAVFFGFQGESVDGNNFAAQAIEKGAVFVVVDNPSVVPVDDNRYILVSSVEETLRELAIVHRKKFSIPVLGITGSNGKTTTKNLCNAVLSKKYKILSTKGNLNTGIGLPLMVLQIKPEHELVILEMGANHVGEIAELCSIARPTHGIITNISAAHVGEFGGIDNVRATKLALFDWLRENGGKAFVSADDLFLLDAVKGIENNTYTATTGTNADIILEVQKTEPRIEAVFEKEFIKSSLFGSHNAINIAAALAVGVDFSVDRHDLVEAISGFSPNDNRSQLIDWQDGTVIMDAYNANEASIMAALDSLVGMPGPHWVILGDMRELGTYAREAHMRVLSRVREDDIRCFLVGEEFAAVAAKEDMVFATTEQAVDYFTDNPISIEGGTLMIKGSRGLALEKIAQVMNIDGYSE